MGRKSRKLKRGNWKGLSIMGSWYDEAGGQQLGSDSNPFMITPKPLSALYTPDPRTQDFQIYRDYDSVKYTWRGERGLADPYPTEFDPATQIMDHHEVSWDHDGWHCTMSWHDKPLIEVVGGPALTQVSTSYNTSEGLTYGGISDEALAQQQAILLSWPGLNMEQVMAMLTAAADSPAPPPEVEYPDGITPIDGGGFLVYGWEMRDVDLSTRMATSPEGLTFTLEFLQGMSGSANFIGTTTNQGDQVAQATYIKHSERKIHTPCSGCGSTNLYFAHEHPPGFKPSPADQGFCQKCKSSGTLVLIEADTLRLHECVGSKPGSEDGEGGGQGGQGGTEGPTSDETDVDPWNGDTPEDAASADTMNGKPEDAEDGKPVDVEAELADVAAELEVTLAEADDSDAIVGVVVGAEGEGDGAGENQPPCPDDDDPVLHSELNELDPVLRPQLVKALESYAETGHLAQLRKAVGSQVMKLTEAMVELERRTRVTISIHDVATDETHEIEGLTHRQLGDVILTLNTGEHCLMVGAAGCGKGEVAYQAAEALGVRFLTLAGSLSPQTPVSSIIGYMNSAGDYVRTTFRDAFENGGLIFLDELDNAHPACVAAVNAALAIRPGQEIGFPDGMVKRSEKVPFVCLAAANTFGRGPDRTYAARQRGDAATWDRFSILNMVYDHALEDVLCRRSGLDDDKCVEIIRYVRGLRMNVEKHQLPHVIGMRASIAMCKLIKGGMDLETAIDARCRRGTSDQDWDKITGDVRKIDFEANWASGMRNRPGAGVATINNSKPPFDVSKITPAVLELIRNGKNIDAIKRLRDENTGMSLVEAKNLVTKMSKAHAAGGETVVLEDGTQIFVPGAFKPVDA